MRSQEKAISFNENGDGEMHTEEGEDAQGEARRRSRRTEQRIPDEMGKAL